MCPNIFTKKEAQTILRVSQKVIDQLLAKNEIEYFRINGRYRISEEAINAFVNAKTVHSCLPEKTQMAAI